MACQMTVTPRVRSAVRAALVASALVALGTAVHAGLSVMSPIVEEGEFEFETKLDHTSDRNSSLNNAQSTTVSVGYGVNSFWFTELETQWKKDPGGKRFYDSTSWENRFQLTPQGKYWLDVGLFAEYEKVVQKGDHDSVTLGLLLQKEFGSNLTTVNYLLTRELGGGHAPGVQVDYRVQTRWRLSPMFEPGVELYGEPGRLGHSDPASQQRTRLGPVVVGVLPVGMPGKVKYELGYLRGLNSASEKNTVRVQFEYEVRF